MKNKDNGLIGHPDKHRARVRFSLEFSNETAERLVLLKTRTDAASVTEVIRRALVLYDVVTEHTNAGGKLIARDDEGNDEHLVVL